MDRFICPQCQAEYAVTGRATPAEREPACEQCDHAFPDRTENVRLWYERIDTRR